MARAVPSSPERSSPALQALLDLFDRLATDPTVVPTLPTNDFPVDSVEGRLLRGVQSLLAEARAAREALARQLTRLGVFTAITRRMLAVPELDALLRVVVAGANHLCDTAGATVGLIDAERSQITFATTVGEPPAYAGDFLAAVLDDAFLEETAVGQALSLREAVVVEDYEAWGDPAHRHAMHMRALDRRVRAFIVAPLLVDGAPIGVLRVHHTTPHAFSHEDVTLVQALADQAALAVEHTRLLRRSQEAAILEERQRLARELHDSVSQVLFSIGLGARTAKTLLERGEPERALPSVEYLARLAETGSAEMRALLFELRPKGLAEEGLVAALAKHGAALGERHQLAVALELGDEPDLSLAAKEALYRVAQEAIHNTVKHAQATRLDLRLLRDADAVILEVADDGRGFDPAGRFPGHLGLVSMRERVVHLGGELTIRSAPGTGTVIRAWVPVAPPVAPVPAPSGERLLTVP